MPIVDRVRDVASEMFLEEYISVRRRLSDDKNFNIAGNSFTFPAETEATAVGGRLEDERLFVKSFLDELVSGDVVYDIGAQYGLFSVLAGTSTPDASIVAFEPMRGANIRTRLNLAAHNISGTTVQAGLTNAEKELPAWLSNTDVGVDTLTTGDAIRKERGIPQPSVIKMDIEGAEKYALEGLTETLSDENCRAVFIELHPEGCFDAPGYEDVGLTDDEIAAARQLLENAGFRVSEVMKRDEQSFWKAER